ncbi:hypothetical protein [Natrinema sp. DC36]|uniref:hypothetical protein n=1 Tax=Natrinema sp. DC36 TaxID=2878680 RepID=UPI001CF09285|nr:hypothetical protein [Natrinema sp. DC36]
MSVYAFIDRRYKLFDQSALRWRALARGERRVRREPTLREVVANVVSEWLGRRGASSGG